MAPNVSLPAATSAAGSVFEWVQRYGLATVFALILLAYGLWLNYLVVSSMSDSLRQISETQRTIASMQVGTGASLADIDRQLTVIRMGVVCVDR